MNGKPKGFVPVMLTPFRADGTVDYGGLTRITELYLEAGASGLFANCLSSEMFELSAEERLSVVEHVVQVASGSVPVVATATFGGPVSQQADDVKRMYETGIEAAIVITNMLVAEGAPDAEFEDRLSALLDATETVPLGLYECPEPFKRVLSAEQLGRYVGTGRVIYHKDTCLDIGLVKAKLAATENRDAFGLYDAYMVHAVESLKAGSAGLSCIQGNYFPELVVWLCEHYDDEGLAVEVDKVQQFFVDHMDVMHHMYPVVAKYFLKKRNLPIELFTRKAGGGLDAGLKRGVDQLFADYEALYKLLDVRLVV